MNLPTYSLADSPHSTILNVCLGVPPSTRPAVLPSSSKRIRPHRKPDLKGKAPQRDQADLEEEEEEQWQDAEYRRYPTRPAAEHPSSADHPAPNQLQEDQNHPLLKHTGWDESFATATAEGWAIYRNFPLSVIHKHVVPNGSLRIVMPLHRTNILYLVGGPPSPLYSPNKVVVYDCSISKAVFTIELSSPVVGLAGRRDKLVVVLQDRVVLFGVNGEGVWEEGEWETCVNPKGLACLGSAPESSLLVFPGRQAGKVQVVHLPRFQPDRPVPPGVRSPAGQPPYPSTAILVAHTTPLASLAITPCGKLIATASVTGTLIRIWNAKSAALVRELRRGTDGAVMWGLRFRPDGLAICASSDKGTIHVWSLAEKAKAKEPSEDTGKAGRPLALLKPYLPKYFHSTWSDAFFRLPGPGGKAPRTTGLPGIFGPSTGPSGEPQKAAGGGGEEREGMGGPRTVEDDVSLVSWILAHAPGLDPPSIEPQIVAITRSGAWFRLRIPLASGPISQPPHPTPTPSKNTALDRSVQLECVEYRRFNEDDEWSDDDQNDLLGRFPS
ncbi:hypothetical protein PTTG_05459 [Puccinia triticina 1-1 BBBD Race 1]|uniref:WD_REPEATS_REGION domain-containing protein n=2 Tax=Puccinia triticina TaxID=208348 RepID=A0A180GSX9_PUCT1|nr:uncharacterized protein PtA15_6A577 [Puccinia triticina]OAV95412.1 hypothetical protein PTTG_05459 [Puccinia triticina 1-1 BBBD Race 1]WAQ85948.1 hypothetical protein PtA15_6A577 [Puccinia triticina]WAR55844.1 hypothetical protein PtB15_6B587 [Puccinia triticina]